MTRRSATTRARSRSPSSRGSRRLQIGDDLYARGLIRSPLTFRTLVEARGVGDKIESGDYQLSPSMTTGEIVTVLSKGASRSGIVVTIPEGWRAEQAAQKVEELGIARADEVLGLVQGGRRPGCPCWPSRCRRCHAGGVPVPRDV